MAGLGSLWGVLVGAVFVGLLPAVAPDVPVIGSSHGQDVVFGLIVVLIMLLLPNGFAGFLGALNHESKPLSNRIRGVIIDTPGFRRDRGSTMRRRVRMGLNRRVLAVLAGAAIVAGIAVTAAFGAHQATPGVSATSIHDRRHVPAHRVGVRLQDDSRSGGRVFRLCQRSRRRQRPQDRLQGPRRRYHPAQTVAATQQLVEQDNVFAIFGSLGTAPNLSIWSYLNTHKVPQALIATGDSYWGFSHKAYPWTIGYQPDYPGEAKIYGQYLNANMPNAKIGVLYQNDAYGKNYSRAFVSVSARRRPTSSARSRMTRPRRASPSRFSR